MIFGLSAQGPRNNVWIGNVRVQLGQRLTVQIGKKQLVALQPFSLDFGHYTLDAESNPCAESRFNTAGQ